MTVCVREREFVRVCMLEGVRARGVCVCVCACVRVHTQLHNPPARERCMSLSPLPVPLSQSLALSRSLLPQIAHQDTLVANGLIH